ncbi:MAG TPA: ABC transporter ATP-binding protein [Bacillota bacterium]|nr:ABC transporter ATP-binding protein [Bacillota bacterium]HOK69520.1 ABC transporter ATP-binding protein [Bacillota bacterium]HPP85915.1 ABC transporter ATP-binding protein [Bacillota bacterium]
MIVLEKLPAAVKEFFISKGIQPDEAVLTMKTDLGIDSVLKDVYIVIDKEKAAVAEGTVLFERRGFNQNGNPVRGEEFEAARFEQFNLAELEDIKVEQLISTGRVTATSGKEPVLLFYFSSTYKHDAGIFCQVANELKKDGKVDEKKIKELNVEDNTCPKCGRRYPDPDRKVCPKCMDKIRLIKKLAKLFLHYKGYIFLIFCSLTMIAGLGAITPYVSNQIFYKDVLAEGGKYYGMIIEIILVMIAIRLVSLGVSLINGVISAKVSAEVTYDMKKSIFSTISRLSLSFFTNRQTGGLMTQINHDSIRIYWFFCDGFPYFVLNIAQLAIFMIIMFTINPLLTLYAFVTVPIFFFSFKLIFLVFEKLYAKAYSRRRSFNSLITDVLNGMRVVKSFSREADEMKRFNKRSMKSAEADTEISTKAAKIFPMLFFLLKIGSYVVWGVGGWQVMMKTGTMDYATLMTFVAYFSLIYGPIEFLADISNWWSECLNSLQRLFEINDAVPDVKEKENPITLEHVRGDVEFRHVSFSYVENRKVIDDISFKVPAGTTLGIVGHTGAGKSTLANLLTRLYDVKEGEILIDGVNVKDLSFETLRRSVAIVSQETYLFRGSILENIRYACPEATNEQVIAAAKIASAHDFIIKYPDGYHTQIGFGNKELSGGERQRISIARAILKNPRILILDEATAAMDTQTERQIQQALNRLTKGRTTIIIAHRLSTLRDADNLIVIENGKMPESGTAKELLMKKGVYYKLYKMQAEALKTIGIEA